MMDNNTSMEKENFFTNGKHKITHIEIGREMQDSFLQYAMSVIVARALPDVRDGLKPVHRRILYTMFEKDLTPDKAYHKCADTVGAVLGSYHPHGDASVYDALVRLAQSFSMRYMLVDGQGNFGSIDGDSAAAMRYTEARLKKIGEEMMQDLYFAYCTTVHKSQGAEYQTVIMVVSEEHKVMLKRNIIYTGVTRAKQNVALIGQTEALNTAILNNQTDVRHTLLGDRLHAAFTVKS